MIVRFSEDHSKRAVALSSNLEVAAHNLVQGI